MSIPDEIVKKAAQAFSKNGMPNVVTIRRMWSALDAVLPDLTAAAVANALKEALPPCGCVGVCEMSPMTGPSYYGRVCEIYLNTIRARSKL